LYACEAILLSPFGNDNTLAFIVEGVTIPDSKLAREITELVRHTVTPLLFYHSSRVYTSGPCR
jgi:hypothetical protein